VRILRTLTDGRRGRHARPVLYCEGGRCYAQCGDGSLLRVLSMEVDGTMLDTASFERIGSAPPAHLPAAHTD
jgi:methionyl-tRNA formyltransferase